MKITYKDMSNGSNRQVPISNFVKFDYNNTLGGVKRKNLKRVITVYSDVDQQKYDVNVINRHIADAIRDFHDKPESITIRQTGQQEEQQESLDFLRLAFVIALGFIFGILVLQF